MGMPRESRRAGWKRSSVSRFDHVATAASTGVPNIASSSTTASYSARAGQTRMGRFRASGPDFVVHEDSAGRPPGPDPQRIRGQCGDVNGSGPASRFRQAGRMDSMVRRISSPLPLSLALAFWSIWPQASKSAVFTLPTA